MAIYRGGRQTTSKHVVMRVLDVKWKVRFAVAEEPGRAALSITQHSAAFCGSETMGRCRGGGEETRNLNLTQEALKATQNKLLSSGIPPPSRKTISTVIKGELNRLISSKVTERPSLSSPFASSFPSFSPHSSVTPARWRPPMKCHQISGGVRGHRTKMFR